MRIPRQDMLPKIFQEGITGGTNEPFRLKMPKPYHDWQKMLINSKIKLMVFPCATKVGKSIAGSSRLILNSFQAGQHQDALYRVIAPTYALSKITYQYLNRLVPENLQQGKSENYDRANEVWRNFTPARSEHAGYFKWNHNGSVIQCLHGDNPEVTIEGARVYGNCFDEAAKLKRQVFDSAMSTTTQTGGWNCLYGTPRGKNWYYDLYRECIEHMDWAYRTGGTLEMFAAQARTIDNPFVPNESIERARKHLPDRIFRQLFMAEFLDDGTVFVGYKDCVFGDRIEIDESHKVQIWTDPEADTRSVVIGVDWAKREDYFVGIAIDPTHNPPKVVGFIRTTHVDYTACVRLLYQFTKKFKEVHVIRHDRTGIGDVLDEMLQPFGIFIEPIVFTNSSKAHLVDRYLVALQSKDVIIPNWKPLLDEHDTYDASVTSLGLPKYGAVSGSHDDIVTAIMLAYSAAYEMRDRHLEVKVLEELNNKDTEDDHFSRLISMFEYDENMGYN